MEKERQKEIRWETALEIVNDIEKQVDVMKKEPQIFRQAIEFADQLISSIKRSVEEEKLLGQVKT